MDLEADESARRAAAAELALVAIDHLVGEATVSAWLDGLRVDAAWRARVTQTCGVTLEAFDAELSGRFQVRAVPPGSPAAARDDPEVEIDLSTPDPPDLLEGGSVDVAALLVEHLALELDPFPRKPGVQFEPPPDESPESPFAVLSTLRPRSDG